VPYLSLSIEQSVPYLCLVTTSAPTPKLQLVEGSSTWVGCALSAECSIGSTRKKFALNPEEKEAGQPSSKLYLASNLATGHTVKVHITAATPNVPKTV